MFVDKIVEKTTHCAWNYEKHNMYGCVKKQQGLRRKIGVLHIDKKTNNMILYR